MYVGHPTGPRQQQRETPHTSSKHTLAAADDNSRQLTLAIASAVFAANKARYIGGDVTASLHVVVPDTSSPAGDRGGDRAAQGGDSPAAPTPPPTGASALLLRTGQASPAFAAATALPPGVHVLCYLPPSEAADRLTWQESCLYLLEEAAGDDSGFRDTLPTPLSLAQRGQTPLQGWALVPCESSDNLICALARRSWKGEGGRVAWFHSTETGELAMADDLLLTS